MKLAIFLALGLVFQTLGKTHAQKITLNVTNVPLREVMQEVQKQQGYSFLFRGDDIADTRVNAQLQEVSFADAMNTILHERGLVWSLDDGIITIVRTVRWPTESIGPLQQRIVFGKVSDEEGRPLEGVTVRVQGTNNTVTTNANGDYEIQIEREGKILVYSMIGFKTVETTVTHENRVDVALETVISDLDEVVVVGYGTQKKINLTGAVSQISAEEFQDRPVTRLTQALQGTIPNLNIVFGSGQPGQSGSLNIRGNTSINGGTPLVLIDGVPGDMDRVNILDVESISVLKDASASAVYGARAAFGVILITTKSGKEGNNITYSTNLGLTTHLTNTDFITSGYTHSKINDEAMYNSLGDTYTRYDGEDYEELLARANDHTEHPDRPWVVIKPNASGQDMYRYYGNFDWFNYLLARWRPRQEHNLSISGAKDNIRYLLSGNYTDEQGIWRINADGFDRYTFRAKIEADITKNLSVSSNTRYFQSAYRWFGMNDNFPDTESGTGRTHIYFYSPAYVPHNPDGTFTGYTGVNSYTIGYGIHALLENGRSRGKDTRNEFATTFEANFTPFEGLTITGNYTYLQDVYSDYYRSVRVQYSKFPGVMETFGEPTLNVDRLDERIHTFRHHVFNVFGNYERGFGNHHITAMAGFNQELRTRKGLYGRGNELLSETLNDLNLTTALQVVAGGAEAWALRGAFYRFNYNYLGKYLLEASGRYDGTSRFSKEDRFGFFPSFSAGWLISEERFFDPIKQVINQLKIRYSHGTLGNQDVATYAYISSMGTGRNTGYLMNGQVLNIINHPAPVASNLTWERSTTNNIGLDAVFFANRLSLTADVYTRDTRDMLTLGRTLPSVFGANEPRENAADLRTKGFELTMGWKDRFELGGSEFSYNINGVLADYTATITRFDNPAKVLSNYYKGQQLGEIWGYSYDGFFKTTEEAQAYAAEVNQDIINRRRVQAPTTELRMLQAGDIKILDLDGNGVINVGNNTVDDPGDRRIIGNSQPRYSYGFNLGASWQGIDVSTFFQGIGRRHWYPHLESQQFWHAYARPYGSFMPANFEEMIWSPDNPDSYFPLLRGYIAQNSELRQENDMYLQDVAYLRLKNLTVGYTFPEDLLSKIGVAHLRVFVSGDNLFTWTKLDTDYIDPEEVMTDPTARTYPMGKIYSAGLQVSF